MTKRERERQAKREQEQQQEQLRRDQLLAKVVEKINNNQKPRVTLEEAARLIIKASKTKKHHGPTSITRAFRAF